MSNHMADNYCPECGGLLTFDVAARKFACKSCGLFLSRDELSEMRDRKRDQEDDKRSKNKERGDYLEWWLSKKG